MKTTSMMAAFIMAFGHASAQAEPLVIDHDAVELYDDIPQAYIDEVKKMWVSVAGESHSAGYRIGATLLENLDARFQVNVTQSGTPEAYTDQHLRLSRATRGDVNSTTTWRYGYGEEDWYTSQTAVDHTKAGLDYCHTNGPALAAIGFGWCWDTTWHNTPGGTRDPVHNVRWAGSSVGGPEGDMRWGLDADDTPLTGNSVNMDTYLQATVEYINHCRANHYLTKPFFTTGPVDGNSGTESGYQREVKHQHIRDFVLASDDYVLFDYADILCWSDAGVMHNVTWNDGGTLRQHPQIHPDNMLDLDGTYQEDGDHIGERGALRLGKALWVMLARLAGWKDAPVPPRSLRVRRSAQ